MIINCERVVCSYCLRGTGCCWMRGEGEEEGEENLVTSRTKEAAKGLRKGWRKGLSRRVIISLVLIEFIVSQMEETTLIKLFSLLSFFSISPSNLCLICPQFSGKKKKEKEKRDFLADQLTFLFELQRIFR